MIGNRRGVQGSVLGFIWTIQSLCRGEGPEVRLAL